MTVLWQAKRAAFWPPLREFGEVSLSQLAITALPVPQEFHLML